MGWTKGCRKISFENEHFSSVTFQCENGKLPSNKVNSLIEDSRGNVLDLYSGRIGESNKKQNRSNF